ncbi:Predicted arabinose efflux permease, MFS family [Sinosporangium album]|uniref:Predicted arabinose efflux permease, MFS family n=1 Tax=Sinosporangium album TaxID=504805 RepID=A0A1G8HHI0_9ACTN|nr:MFS transporter [Sinosporangium album]SDI05900.1 Predicted arabinose efflux permease, MFS family [Sinosporangium album]
MGHTTTGVAVLAGEAARARRRGAVSRSRIALVVAVCAGTMALATADSTAAVLSLSAMAELAGARVPADQAPWMGVAYLVPFAALLPATGRLADLLGRRLLLGLGLGLFTVSAFAAAVSDSWIFLLAARAGQGIGSAAMIPASLGLLLCELPTARRHMAVAIWSGASGLGGLLLHAGGWWLADGYGWRALFMPSVAVGTVLLLAATGLPRSRGSRGRLPDPLGLSLLAVGTGAAALAVSRGAVWGWRSPLFAGVLVGGLLLVAASVRRSRRHPVPTVDTSLWRREGFALGWAASALYGMTAFPLLMVAPAYLREWGFAAAQVGPIMVAVFAGLVIAGPMAGWMCRRVGPHWLVYGGAFLVGGACLALLTGSGPSPLWLAAAEVLGVGLGTLAIGAFTVGTLGAYPSQYASAVGTHMTAQQLGGIVGVAVASALVETPILSGPMAGYTSVFLACLILSLSGGAFALIAIALSGRVGRRARHSGRARHPSRELRPGRPTRKPFSIRAPRNPRSARPARVAVPLGQAVPPPQAHEQSDMVAIPRRVLIGLRAALVDVATVADALLPPEGQAGERFGCECHPGLDPLAARLVHEALAHESLTAQAEVFHEDTSPETATALPRRGERRSIETGPIPKIVDLPEKPAGAPGPLLRVPSSFGAGGESSGGTPGETPGASGASGETSSAPQHRRIDA